MATRLTSQFKQYQHKRFVALSSAFFLVLSLATLAFFAFYVYPNQPLLQSILLLSLLVFLVFIVLIKQYMMTISMYLHYFRMIEDKMPVLYGKNNPYGEKFTASLLKQGFLVGVKKNYYTIFYHYVEKLPYVQRTAASLIVIIQTFVPGLSIHHQGIEDEIAYLKTTLVIKKPIQNELTLIIKRFETLDAAAKDDLDQIINFSLGNRAVVTLQLGEFADQSMYFLRPKKVYPNKHYYALTHLVYDLIKME